MGARLELLALILGFIGLFGAITATALPTWRVSAFIGANIVVIEDLWEGLWMACFRQANIRMQCKQYDSVLILSPELQASRALMCTSIVLVVLSMMVTACGIQKSKCLKDDMRSKNITLALAGGLYLLSCLTTLIPPCWVGHTIIINFYNPALLDAEKHELGSAIFISWATSGVLLITGIILLFSYSKRSLKEEGLYTDAYHMVTKDSLKEESIRLERTPSSSHKHHEYV